jgi:hypothetical protein
VDDSLVSVSRGTVLLVSPSESSTAADLPSQLAELGGPLVVASEAMLGVDTLVGSSILLESVVLWGGVISVSERTTGGRLATNLAGLVS